MPRGWFHFAHICDAPAEIPTRKEEMVHILREARMDVGKGGIDVAEILHHMPPVVLSIEEPNIERVREMGYAEHAFRCLEAAKSYIDAHEGAEPPKRRARWKRLRSEAQKGRPETGSEQASAVRRGMPALTPTWPLPRLGHSDPADIDPTQLARPFPGKSQLHPADNHATAIAKGGMMDTTTKTLKYVYAFEEGDGRNRMLLGGKGAGLCEMTQIGLNVPPGFVVSAEACLAVSREEQAARGPDGRDPGTTCAAREEDRQAVRRRRRTRCWCRCARARSSRCRA